MDDIIKRLNKATPYGLEDFTVLRDAVAEIERLRRLAREWSDGLDDALDEIERLRAAGDLLAAALRAETVSGRMAVCDKTIEALNAWEI